LYFTTPNVHKNDSKEDDQYGKYQLELTTLFRIKLDGTGLKELYTTKTATALIYLAKLDGKQNVLIFDDSKLLRINVSNNSVAVQNLVDEGVVSVVFPNKAEAELTNIYFTKNRAEGDTFTGNKLARYNFSTNAQEDVSGYSNNGETTTLVSYDGNVLFYTRTGKGQDALYSNDFSAGAGSEVLHKYHIEGISTTSYVTIIDGNGEYDINAFVYEYGDNIYLQDMGAHADNPDDRIVSEKADIVFVDGTYVYYTTENGIFRISALTKQTEQITDTQGFEAGKVDFDGEYVYYFAKPENVKSETKYLYRAVVENGGEIKAECIAEILADDISEEKPETEEE